jgi:hypothetical protein
LVFYNEAKSRFAKRLCALDNAVEDVDSKKELIYEELASNAFQYDERIH